MGKIFDLEFLPAMNGESGACASAGVGGGLGTWWLLVMFDTQPFYLNRIPENFILSLFI